MTLFDLLVLLVMATSVLFGATRGLTREAITLVALFAGVVVVAVLGGPLGGIAGGTVAGTIAVIGGLFAIGFVLVHVALEMIGRRLIGADPHRPDRLLGGVFGLVRGWLLAGLAYLSVSLYYEGAPMPEVVEGALTRGLAASGAAFLDGLLLPGDDPVPESVEIID